MLLTRGVLFKDCTAPLCSSTSSSSTYVEVVEGSWPHFALPYRELAHHPPANTHQPPNSTSQPPGTINPHTIHHHLITNHKVSNQRLPKKGAWAKLFISYPKRLAQIWPNFCQNLQKVEKEFHDFAQLCKTLLKFGQNKMTNHGAPPNQVYESANQAKKTNSPIKEKLSIKFYSNFIPFL